MKHYLLQCSYVLQPHPHEHKWNNLALLVLISLLFALYILAAFTQWQKRRKWHKWRLASFAAGYCLTGVALSPAMSDYAHHDFSGHMIQHLALGMLAPIGLVLGAPVLLTLQSLPKKEALLLGKVLNNPVFHFISHPLAALALNMGSMYILYLTPLYGAVHENTALHFFMHFHFLAAGYLFTWTMIGPDPAGRRPRLLTRVVVLFMSIGSHSFLSKMMFAYHYPRSTIHSKEEIQAAAKMMYYGGDVFELLLVIVLFSIWYYKKGKPHYQFFPEG